jgi:hypothetical protein
VAACTAVSGGTDLRAATPTGNMMRRLFVFLSISFGLTGSAHAQVSTLEIKERPAMACLARATLQRMMALAGRRDGSYEWETKDNLRSGRCRYLSVGSQLEVTGATFFFVQVTAPWLNDRWWIHWDATWTQREKDDQKTRADLFDDQLMDRKLKQLKSKR